MPETITIDEVKSLIKEEGIKPSDLFNNADLTDDPFIKGFVNSEIKEAKAGEYGHRKRTDEAFDKAREDWEKKEKELTDENTKLKKDVAKISAGETLDKLIEEGKIEGKEKDFLQDQFKKFTVEDVAKVEDEVKAFIEDKKKEHGELAKHFGVKEGEEETDEGETEKKPGSEPGDEGSGGGEDNPFITQPD